MQKHYWRKRWVWSLFSFGFGIGWVGNAFAELNYLQLKGVHEILKPEFKYLSPVHGFTTLKTGTLANFRFFGSYGEKNVGFECKEPFLSQKDCPQDATSFFLQRLFPSPDGTNFVANQVKSDLLSRFKPSTIGKILGNLSKVNPQDLNEAGRKAHLIEELIEITYEDLNREDFNQNTSKIGNKIPAYKKATQDIKKYEKNLESCEKPEEHQELTRLIEELRGTLSELEPKVAAGRRSELKKKKGWQELAPFFEALVESWQENQKKNSPYPAHFVEHSLLAYLWLKQNNKEDFLDLYRNMQYVIKNEKSYLIQNLENIRDESIKNTVRAQQQKWLSKAYTLEDYESWKDDFQYQEPTAEQIEELEEDPEFSSFLAHSYYFNDRILPPLLSYSQAAHKSLGKAQNGRKYDLYPDCGETSLRNFFNFILYDEPNKTFDPEILKSISERHQLDIDSRVGKKDNSKKKGLIGFYERNSGLDSITSIQARDDWSRRVVSGLPHVNYLKPQGAPVCEINAGVNNMLSVIEGLLGDFQEENSLGNISKNVTKDDPMTLASKKFDRICELFSREGFTLDWKVRGREDKNIPQNTGVKLIFSINGSPAFSWDFQGGHFVIDDLTGNQSDWRVQVGRRLALNAGKLSESTISNLPWYIHKRNFDPIQKEFLKAKKNQTAKHLLFSLPLQSNENKLFAIENIFENFASDNELKSVVLRLISKLPEDDVYAQSKIVNSAKKNQVQYANEIQDRYFQALKSPEIQKAAVFESAYQGYLELLKALEQKGADLNAKDDFRLTPLHRAVESGKWDVAQYLAEKIPQAITEKSTFGNTPFHSVVKGGSLDIVRFLAEKNPDAISIKDRDGKIPLHLAVKGGLYDVVLFLAEKDPRSLSAKDEVGNTPLHLAAKGGRLDVAQFLAKKNHDMISEPNDEGKTPLHLAAKEGKLDLIQFLAEENRDSLLIKDKKGKTALRIAREQGNYKVIKYIESLGIKE
jgi:ankyrin repeat protein